MIREEIEKYINLAEQLPLAPEPKEKDDVNEFLNTLSDIIYSMRNAYDKYKDADVDTKEEYVDILKDFWSIFKRVAAKLEAKFNELSPSEKEINLLVVKKDAEEAE